MSLTEELVALSDDEAAQLRNYTLAKQQVTASARAAKQLLQAYNKADGVEQAQALLVKLAEDRFNLAVVGQFKRGKSSLMNAVIGRDLLPTGLLPLTSAITTLCYGPQEQVLLRRKGWSLEQTIALDQLADYITERGNPGNEKELIEARVELPAPLLRRGLHFIDTPGVGSTQQANTATTYGFLPEVDAVIFVTSVDAPLSETEQRFLWDIRAHVRKLFIVVNKIDLLNVRERNEVLGYISKGIETTLETRDVRLFPISAQQALAAKTTRDLPRLRQSGLLELEDALTTFLANDQGRIFLATVLDRVLSLLTDLGNGTPEQMSGDSTSMELAVMPNSLRAAVESLRSALLESPALAPVQPLHAPVLADVQDIAKALTPGQANQPRVSLRSRTCPICSVQTQAIFDYFAHWQYALAKSEAAQHAFAAAHGFCAVHTWQFQQIAAPQGISQGYAPLIEAVLEELRPLVGQAPRQAAAQLEALLSSTQTCAACRVLHDIETEQIRQLFAQLEAPDGLDRYVRSEGLCLPHLHTALAAASDGDLAEFLLQAQVRRLEEISEDLHAYTLKRDALRRGLLNSQEEHAWRRALVQLVGERTVRTPIAATL
jgi:predicted GTPase